jgi:hypothetical protein
MDPTHPEVLYFGSHRLWRTDEGGFNWIPVSEDLTRWVPGARLGTITTIGVSPADPNVVWIGTDDANLWRGEREAGGSFVWTGVTAPNLPERWVTRVLAHPSDPLSAWATFNGLKWKEDESHVFYTDDGGATWSDRSGNLPEVPVNAIAVDPAHPTVVFVGTDLGAYYSDDNGVHWHYLSPDLPMVSVYDLAIHPVSRSLLIGTHGRGMYTMDLGALVSARSPRVAGLSLGPGVPNPFAESTRISLTLARRANIRLEVFDAAGRRVRTLLSGVREAGRHEALWDGRDDRGQALRSGHYRCRLALSGGASATQSLTLVR